MRLLIFGFGYSGQAIARAAAARGEVVTATTRDTRSPAGPPGVEVVDFAACGPAIARATHLLSTVPPGGDGGTAGEGEPVLARWGEAIAAARDLQWLGYMSTTGVYGDRGGGWVDEHTAPAPGQERSRRRWLAEQRWAAFADKYSVDIFRTAGIYGPGRSALDELRAGRGRSVVRPGHAFGRIHRDDIAGAVLAAAAQRRPPGPRVLHLSDDEPAESAAVMQEAARLLGVPPPPAIAYEPAAMSAMARSFWAENRRVASRFTQEWLGRRWAYPSYREGLRAILAEQAADRPAQQGEVGRT